MTDSELAQALQYCAKEDGCCEQCAMQDWCDGLEEVLLQASSRLDSLLSENDTPTTNSDYVRRLNDDEFADFLVLSPEIEFNICCLCKYGNHTPSDDRGQCLALYACNSKARAAAFKKWLKQPYKSSVGRKDRVWLKSNL